MFACEHFGVQPDILVLGKGLGGGVMPLAAIVARHDLDLAADRSIGHYTHEKNPVCCAAGLATIEYIEREGLVQRSEDLGAFAVSQLRELQQHYACIGEVRGAGLLIGVQLVDSERFGRATDLAEWLMYQAMARGMSFKISSGSVLTLCPPLVITRAQLEEAVAILAACFAAAERRVAN
jgi:4-aminobutyrate aminotransferase